MGKFPTIKAAEELERANRAIEDKFISKGHDSACRNAVRFEYEKQHLHDWDNERVYRLCRLFHCTVHELCAIAGEFENQLVARYLRTQYWPMTLTVQWNKLLRARMGMRVPDSQDMLAAKYLKWKEDT
jgi:hypothetical protein